MIAELLACTRFAEIPRMIVKSQKLPRMIVNSTSCKQLLRPRHAELHKTVCYKQNPQTVLGHKNSAMQPHYGL
jgi:hypothetical protein